MKKLLIALVAGAIALSACSSDKSPNMKKVQKKHHHHKASAINS